jgi:segregation and condensation protein B
MDNNILRHIEALVFISREAISPLEIQDCIQEALDISITKEDLEAYMTALIEKYKSDEFAYELVGVNGGYKLMTKGAYFDTLAIYLKQTTKKRLSRAALETLSLIAYKQPVTKSELEKIRGVNCDYSIQKLLEKELVEITGRSDGPGRPLFYGTGEKFMNYFGISDLSELPKTKDFKMVENEVGEAAPIEEDAYVISLPDEEE